MGQAEREAWWAARRGGRTHHKRVGRIEPEGHGEILSADEADDDPRCRRSTGCRTRRRARGGHAHLAAQHVFKSVVELLAEAVLGVCNGVAHETRGRGARYKGRQLGCRAHQQHGREAQKQGHAAADLAIRP